MQRTPVTGPTTRPLVIYFNVNTLKTPDLIDVIKIAQHVALDADISTKNILLLQFSTLHWPTVSFRTEIPFYDWPLNGLGPEHINEMRVGHKSN